MNDGREIRRTRTELSIAQCELASEAGINAGRLSQAEHGHITLRPDEMERVEMALWMLAERRIQALVQAAAAAKERFQVVD